ncbi:class I SAM-dependent methyltransferase [Aureimonas sp. AU20]|uniref:class I SAM-dependent methyltransferase n=1 Tax=Aureimonas sp. AU20 TaxID=1349819 RepID=UPI00072185DE|nr:class I SAM-dependent methyltransferase [Aureimonas sp. AU20]ALN74782.1 hypothetical protein M673_18840 [Aureimonas sp. AU20]
MSSSSVILDNQSLVTPAQLRDHHGGFDMPTDERWVLRARDQLRLTFSIALGKIGEEQPWSQVLNWLSLELHSLRRAYPDAVWRKIVPIAQAHPLTDLLRLDPFTDWSFRKPRGYSGDAQLLDFIYGHASQDAAIAKASTTGAAIFECTRRSASSAAVRERRDLLAAHVDTLAAEQAGETEILTIAAGHLREAALSTAFQSGRIGRWVALDQDPESLAGIAADYAGTSVEPVEGSVAGLLRGAYGLGTFDFVYAAGLYDYLPRAVAVKLTRRCMAMLKPGGRFLFANFSDRTKDDGFMEVFMNWELLLRSDEEMWDIINASIDRNTVEASVVPGENGEIAYGLIRKLC